MTDHSAKLRVSEIFHSLQGESTRAGLPTVFVRLTGCPLRCAWCDTEYAFSGGETLTLGDVLIEVAKHGARQVCVTGGEPLAQKACLPLLVALCDAGYAVSLETSGALDVAAVNPRVARIVDLKAPASGESDKNLWDNLPLLNARDEIKIVLADETDYDWARNVIGETKARRDLSGAAVAGGRETRCEAAGRVGAARPPAGARATATAQAHLGCGKRALSPANIPAHRRPARRG